MFINAALIIFGLTWIAPNARGVTVNWAERRGGGPPHQYLHAQIKSFTVTTVPLLVHEQTSAYDYPTNAFSRWGS